MDATNEEELGRGASRSARMMNQTRDIGPMQLDDVETVAREIQVRGATVPAVLFLEANRASCPLEGQAMLFFDPVIRGVFGGDLLAAQALLADEDGIERLIERLEEFYDEVGLDA
ncbi:hypothetical protein BH23CHL8_BH23CHL8_11940 [soil metagenome]